MKLSAQGTCIHSDLYKNFNIWHLVNEIHPETPWHLMCFALDANFLFVDYFYLRMRYLMKITLFDDFDMWQNMDVNVLIERI